MSRGIAVTLGTYLPRNVNQYVPGLQSHAQVDPATQIYRTSLGNPVSGTGIILSQSINTAVDWRVGSGISAVTGQIDATGRLLGALFGRALTIAASGATTALVEIWGRDYLGQPIYSARPLNGGVQVVHNKAFVFLDRIRIGAAAGLNVTLATTNQLGLPFRTVRVLAEESQVIATGVQLTHTLGTLAVPESILTAPSATTADPRGLYTPNAVLASTTDIAISAIADADIDSTRTIAAHDGEAGARIFGGLYGRNHFFQAN